MRVQISTDPLPERARVAFWNEAVCQSLFNVTPALLHDSAMFRARLDVHIAGRFALIDVEWTNPNAQRTSADLARSQVDKVLLHRVISPECYRVGGAEYALAPGDLCIPPPDAEFHCHQPEGIRGPALVIPRAVLNPLLAGGQLPVFFRQGGASPLGALLRDALDSAAVQVPKLPAELGDAVLHNLAGLVALACGASVDGRETGRGALRAAHLDAARRHVERHLAEPDLAPAGVAAALGISVRQLHVLFEPTGTSFARYMQQRRLEACRAALTSPLDGQRSVADIAFGWGFNSLSVFYRAFQAAFGLSPGEVREAARRQRDG